MSDLTAQQWNDLYRDGMAVTWERFGEKMTGFIQGDAFVHQVGVPVVLVRCDAACATLPIALSLLTPIEPERPAEVRLEDCVLLISRKGGRYSIRCGDGAIPELFDRIDGQAILDAVEPLIRRAKSCEEK